MALAGSVGMVAHTPAPSHANRGGGWIGMALAGSVGMVAGVVAPIGGGGNKNKKKIEQLYKVIQVKNGEVS